MARRALSQQNFVKMLLAQGATIPCGKCGRPIENPKNIMREHLNPLAMSNDDSVENQQLWHKNPCSYEKTNGTKATSYGSDKHAIAKAKRLTGETKGPPKRQWPSRPIQSRGFEKRKEPTP